MAAKTKPPPEPVDPAAAHRQWPASKIELRLIRSLTPYASNPRVHSPQQVNQIIASIREWGWTIPILIDEEGTIIAGHGRAMAAEKMGLTEVPVMIARGWTDAQKRAYVIADNQLTINASWDEPLLRIELGELKKLDFELGLVGFDEVRLATFIGGNPGNGDPEATPEPQARAISRLGDLWLFGKHRLLCGDATSKDDVATALGKAKPNLMVTDPPYGVDYDPSWRARDLPAWKAPKSTGVVPGDDTADWSAAWCLFPGDVAYTWHPAGARSAEHLAALNKAGFEARMQIIWAKPHFPIGRGNYHVQHEPCWYAVRKGKTANWQGSRTQSTLWQIDNASAFKGSRGVGDEQSGHGTQKPVECMKRPIENNSLPGEAVYDPFVGSGTTIIAAEMTGRHAIAIEIDPVYVDVAVRRWQKFTGQKAILDGTTKPFEHVEKERAEPVPA